MGLTNSQKALVSQFQAITGSDAFAAQACLQATQWHLEAACNQFLDGGTSFRARASSSGALDQGAIARLFDKYKDTSCDLMMAEGVGKFCEDLQVDPADIVMLVISYHFQAENSCEYTRSEFLAGMNKLGCDSIQKLKRKLPELRKQLENPNIFQEVYKYTYQFSREKGQKCVQLDMAIPMWQLIFSAQPWPLLDAWCAFLETYHKRAISKDTWIQLLDFIKTIKPDLSNFDDNAVTSAWPYLIDDFVQHLREKSAVPKGTEQNASEQSVFVLD